jgi:DNA-directed RNA polymerase
MTTRQKLLASLKTRVEDEIAPQNPLKFLKQMKVEDYLDTFIATAYLYTRPRKGLNKQAIYLAEIISAIGHNVRGHLKLKRDSALAAKLGAFLLYSLEEYGLVQVMLGQGTNGHSSYVVQVLNDEAICLLWASLTTDKVEKLPSLTPFAPWATSRHATGLQLVKTGNKGVLEALTPETHPFVFNCVNRAQTIGWNINKGVYDLHLWALKNKTDAFADIWELQNPEAKATKLREAKAIGEIASRFIGKTFYHLYYYDFRGRKYPNTAYLHEQGSDLAKSLLLQAEPLVMGKQGFFWLCHAIASNWAGPAGRTDGLKTDKIPLKDRYEWVLENEEILLSYAESPKVNQGWMKADSPWQFIAACFELKKLREWQYVEADADFDNYNYPSGFIGYIDGSNNGSQHLSALTKDEHTAPHVNLVPQELPGDLYKYVADHVWQRLEAKTKTYTDQERLECDRFIDNLVQLKKQLNESEPKSDLRKSKLDEVQDFKMTNAVVADIAAPVFWLRITDAKHKRKVVKRNVMTLPYGGTAYGLGQQQIDDARKHDIDVLLHMEHRWGAYLGREIFEDCRLSLKRPMQLLSVFEEAGRKAEARGEFLSWKVPVTNFPVVQNYTEGIVKKVWVQYGPPIGERTSTGYFRNTLQLAICHIENVVPSKGKQSSGASPNAIHSLDAAHLVITVANCDFPVTTIHDSFGARLGDLPRLFKIVRESFVQLYDANPLATLMEDIQGDVSNVEFGTLDVSLILDSEYAFS